jgi:hypothetical protein
MTVYLALFELVELWKQVQCLSIGKQPAAVTCPHNAPLLNDKNERMINAHHNMDGSQNSI